MLTINLLPTKRRSKARGGKKRLIAGLLIVLALGAGIVQAKLMLSRQVQHLVQEKKHQTAVKNRLFKQVSELKSIKRQLDDMRQRISVIRKIRKKQALPVRYLDEIAGAVPNDKMWFESLSMDNKGRISLRGVALDNQVFARYLQHLRQSPYIADISLQQTQRKTIRDLGLVGFRCRISAAPDTSESGAAHG